jgi:[acyl-carrier-protein] S-malonyltransferase
MSKKVAFIFPGQGAQYPGMGRDFYENFPAAKAVFDQADHILGYAFSELIFNGPKEELTLTKNSQLAIFITSIAILRVYHEQNPDVTPTICGGLSLGEYTALVAAGKLTFEEALPLVQARGAFMDQACTDMPGTMHVVLGLEVPVVEKALEELEGVWIANLNCPGQIVISGTKEGIEKAAVLLKEKGAKRVLPLDVSGAFHSGLMQSAQDRLEMHIRAVNLQPSEIDIVMNVSGASTADLDHMRKNMTEQVTKPVRWQSCVEAMLEKGVELFVEMGPGKSLAGMNKRIGVSVPTISIEKVEELTHAPVA